MLMFLPSMKPVSFSPWKKAAREFSRASPGNELADLPLRKPITLRGSCARAGDIHAAAPPRRVMNSRRLMGFPDAEDYTLPHRGKKRSCASQQNWAARVGSGPRLFSNSGRGV